MSTSCIYIPVEKNEENNKVFEGALELTGNRDFAIAMYGMSKSADVRMAHNITDENIGFDEFAEEINIEKYLSQEDKCKYLTKKNGFEKSSEYSLYDAIQKGVSAIDNTEDVVPSITKSNEEYKISIVPKSEKAVDAFKNNVRLNELNERLLGYLNSLGFDVSFNDTDESYFSPMDADVNANNLKEIISLAKGKKGEVDLPEEFSHFLTIAFQDHPLGQRLKNLITDELAKVILGDTYEQYKERYSSYYNASEMLRLEAMGKLVAQNIVDNKNVFDESGNTISYVSQKFSNALKRALSLGSETKIDEMIADANRIANEFVSEILGNKESIKFFNSERLNFSGKLYRTSQEISTNINKLDAAIDNILATYAKRLKILTLKREEGKIEGHEMKTYELLKAAKRKHEYDKGCIAYLKYCIKDSGDVLSKLKAAKEKFDEKKDVSLRNLKYIFRSITDISNIVSAYSKTTASIALIKKEFADEMSDENRDEITALASEVNDILFELDQIRKELQVDSLAALFKQYWTDGVYVDGENVPLTLEDILQSGVGDISGINRMINSMNDMADPYLQMADMLYKDICHKRDRQIVNLKKRIAFIHKRYVEKTGSNDTSFLYAKDGEGKLTGMIKSEYDYVKFRKDRLAAIEDFKRLYTVNGVEDKDEIRKHISMWDDEHMETIEWFVPEKDKPIRQRVPRKSMYKSNDLQSLSDAQKEYYNDWLDIKKEMDSLIGRRFTSLFRAPQKKIDIKEAMLQGKDIKGIMKRMRDKFVTVNDDMDFGFDGLSKDGLYTITDLAGNPIKRIPVYYNVWLDKEDMDMLDTNASDALMSYSAMAINYKEMNGIADAFDVLLMQFSDRDIKKISGKQKLFDKFRLSSDPYESELSVKGSTTEEYKKLLNYIDKNIYGKGKDIEEIHIGKVTASIGKTADVVKEYSTHMGLGFNIFSATTNASMGILQNMLMAVGHDYFGDSFAQSIKNLLTSTRLYNEMLPAAMLETYNDEKKSKLNLLIERFDILDDIYRESSDTSFNMNAVQKGTKKFNPMFGMSAGEHFLHCIPAIAVLRNTKVLVNGVESTMYDALEVVEVEKYLPSGKKYTTTDLQLKNGTTDLNGKTLNENDLVKVKRIIHEANNKAHGAYSDIDKGDAHRKAVGRLLLQFRQWMPAFYFNRFAGERVNLKTGEKEEGYYRTAAKFILGSYHDKEMQAFHLVANWNKLTKKQKKAVRQASVETALFYMICMILSAMGKVDPDDPAFLNLLKYNLYRLRTELGGAVPSTHMMQSFLTLFKTPMPVINNMDTMFDLFNFTDIGRTIQSGKYKGWNKWVRTAYKTIPYFSTTVDAWNFTQGEVDKLKPYMQ